MDKKTEGETFVAFVKAYAEGRAAAVAILKESGSIMPLPYQAGYTGSELPMLKAHNDLISELDQLGDGHFELIGSCNYFVLDNPEAFSLTGSRGAALGRIERLANAERYAPAPKVRVELLPEHNEPPFVPGVFKSGEIYLAEQLMEGMFSIHFPQQPYAVPISAKRIRVLDAAQQDDES